MMDVQDCFAMNLRSIRRHKDITQEALAKKAELSLATIQLLETGKRWPGIKTLRAIAEALCVDNLSFFSAYKTPGLPLNSPGQLVRRSALNVSLLRRLKALRQIARRRLKQCLGASPN
jgi:transcriptional regulator with XRE-family HTH domain